MARLSGSFPFMFNGVAVGTVYILGHDEYGITCDIRVNNTALFDEVTELVRLGNLPGMSFGFATGIMQVIEPDALDFTSLQKEWDELSEEDKITATRNYMQARFEKRDLTK